MELVVCLAVVGGVSLALGAWLLWLDRDNPL